MTRTLGRNTDATNRVIHRLCWAPVLAVGH